MHRVRCRIAKLEPAHDHASPLYRPSLYRHYLYRRCAADRRRQDRGARLRRLVRRQCGHRRVLLREARDRARPAGLGSRRLARPHVHRHGGEIRDLDPPSQGRRVLAFLRDAERRPARDRPLPRRPLQASLSAAEHHRVPRAACRRAPGRCRARLRQDMPRGRDPDLARRRRAALEHARIARIHRRRGRRRAPVRADAADAERHACTICARAASVSAASRWAAAACFITRARAAIA